MEKVKLDSFASTAAGPALTDAQRIDVLERSLQDALRRIDELERRPTVNILDPYVAPQLLDFPGVTSGLPTGPYTGDLTHPGPTCVTLPPAATD